jgi:hypothetical protein
MAAYPSLLCDGRILGAAVGLIHAEFGVRRAESSTWRLEAGEQCARYAARSATTASSTGNPAWVTRSRPL